ncbi:hypothetical protein [Cypionkella sp.]|uniref:hypothetical protein n=2 Tax=Cypionkella sp. TaxID=2811411 RepID=UPI002722A7ED|nr:hypothetical protein [Cypionkella sp.]MDO8984024.1 hypothetical protein [Cypionkella sp.]
MGALGVQDEAVVDMRGQHATDGIVSALPGLMLQSARAVAANADEQKLLEDRHYSFDLALIAGCGFNWLLEFFQRLYVEAER